MGSFFAMINPKNNSENLKRNIHYKIITQPHRVVYIQCQQKSVKMSDKLHFLWQDKKANKVVKTHRTVFLLGVSHIWYQNNILKTFEKFWSHGSNSYSRSQFTPLCSFSMGPLLKFSLEFQRTLMIRKQAWKIEEISDENSDKWDYVWGCFDPKLAASRIA